VTGQCGPQALRVLETAGIKVITGCEGTARQVLKRIRQVGLAKLGSPSDQSASEASGPVESSRELTAAAGRAPPPTGFGLGRRQGVGRIGGRGGGEGVGRGGRNGVGARGGRWRLGWP
jgi:hypothetical protein